MNDKDTATAAAPQQARRWYHRKRFWLLGLLTAFVLWLFIPSTYSSAGIRFSVHYSGTPGTITFVVRDSRGAPLPGITVMSESESGTNQGVTDASGVGTIRPGEAEVLAVSIAGREFRFRPRGSDIFLDFLAPDCSLFGLTLYVTIRNERNA